MSNRYTSTRERSRSFTFEEALSLGYAPDGGLFVPEKLPVVDEVALKEWSYLTYPELSAAVLRLFISTEELSDPALAGICASTFEGFEDRDHAVPIVQLGSVYVAELFHGPTFCFKDIGMRAVVGMLSHFSTLRKIPTTLLVSTTGDTGPAAVQAVSDLGNPLLTILVHYPKGQISEFQRRQLTTVKSKCVHVVAFEGGGDDMDKPIKNICTTQNGRRDHRICGVNSYNVGRPLMQAVHFVWTYLRVMQQLGKEPCKENILDIVLPTGAMGNIAGGYIAKKCGLPLGTLCAGVNVNDIVFRAFQTGKYHKSQQMLHTLSDAINIQLPYNFERLLFYLTDSNHVLVNEWMTCVDETSKLDLNIKWLTKLQAEFRSARVPDDKMCATLKKVAAEFGYIADPHTAVALAAAEDLGYFPINSNGRPVAVLATASPCKFRESMTVALGEEGWRNYEAKDFPARGRDLLAKEEIPPTVYTFNKGLMLEDVQVEWEKLARAIIEDLGMIE